MPDEIKIKKWERVVGEDRDRLREHVVTLYTERKMSVRAISEETQRSYGAVYRLLEEAEVTLRPRGNPKVR